MRLYFTLIITVVVLAFIAGYSTLLLRGSYAYSRSDEVEITNLKESFTLKTPRLAEIDIGTIYGDRERAKLFTPIYDLIDDDYWKNRQKKDSSYDCLSTYHFHRYAISSKEMVWNEFWCGHRIRLPDNFFQVPPFMHKSGHSYAYLAYRSGVPSFGRKNWVIDNVLLFHVLELTELEKELGQFPGIGRILATFDNETLKMLAYGAKYILTREYYFSRANSQLNNMFLDFFNGPNLEYVIYRIDDLKRFLRQSSYEIGPYQKDKKCFYRDGQICWQYNLRYLFQLANKTNIIFFVISIIVIVLVIIILLSKIKNQRLDDERRRLALQVLTHEFRTPISSMLLLIELINSKFDSLDEELQDSCLRLASEIYRLQRLTERSRSYLHLHKGKSKKLIVIKRERIASINQFVLNAINENENEKEIEFKPVNNDLSLWADPYWLGICLKNLIENAILHGRPPYKLELSIKGKSLRIMIEDQGKCQFDNLNDLTGEFVKGGASQGSGLGLSIVKKVITDMGGKLEFNSCPTRFILIFEIKNKIGKGHD